MDPSTPLACCAAARAHGGPSRPGTAHLHPAELYGARFWKAVCGVLGAGGHKVLRAGSVPPTQRLALAACHQYRQSMHHSPAPNASPAMHAKRFATALSTRPPPLPRGPCSAQRLAVAAVAHRKQALPCAGGELAARVRLLTTADAHRAALTHPSASVPRRHTQNARYRAASCAEPLDCCPMDGPGLSGTILGMSWKCRRTHSWKSCCTRSGRTHEPSSSSRRKAASAPACGKANVRCSHQAP
jgi:hypothetical protein